MAIVIREKKIYCGDNFLEVDIYPRTEEQDIAAMRRRRKRENVTPPKVKVMNERRSKRNAMQLVMTNYYAGDYFITLTYDDAHLPDNSYKARREFDNLIRRANYRRKKRGESNIKYFVVDGNENERSHHHMIVPGDIDVNELIECWGKGFVNTRIIQPDADGRFDGLLKYLENQQDELDGQESIADMEHNASRQRYRHSQNLEKPQFTTNDSKFSKRKVEKLAKNPPTVQEIENLYPGWTPIANGFDASYNDLTGLWYLHFRLKRKYCISCNSENGAGIKIAKQTTAPSTEGKTRY
jgi:hypothetical protein